MITPLGRMLLACVSTACAFALALGIFASPEAEANGGTVQISSQPAGPYQVSVFTAPSPITVGMVDVSVLVQKPGSTDLVEGVQVTVTADPVGHTGEAGEFEATHEQATNKLYYAADVPLQSEGRWRIGVQLSGAQGEGATSFEVDATPESLLDRPLTVALLVAVPVLAVLAWLLGSGRKLSRAKE